MATEDINEAKRIAIEKSEAALAAARGAAADWRPITTAPKGVSILLWWTACLHAHVGRWDFDDYREGWKCEGDECVPKNQHNCTHWMPLPKPPNDQAHRSA